MSFLNGEIKLFISSIKTEIFLKNLMTQLLSFSQISDVFPLPNNPKCLAELCPSRQVDILFITCLAQLYFKCGAD